jgi:hypothetical protein
MTMMVVTLVPFCLFPDTFVVYHSSGQGIRRCCTLAVLEGTQSCGVVSHAVQAEVPPKSFCVKTKVKGGKGALTSKCISE